MKWVLKDVFETTRELLKAYSLNSYEICKRLPGIIGYSWSVKYMYQYLFHALSIVLLDASPDLLVFLEQRVDLL